MYRKLTGQRVTATRRDGSRLVGTMVGQATASALTGRSTLWLVDDDNNDVFINLADLRSVFPVGSADDVRERANIETLSEQLP